MKSLYFVICSLYLIYLVTLQYASAQTTTVSSNMTGGIYQDFDPLNSYCFRFTWVGPLYDNSTFQANETCKSHIGIYREKGIPCHQPLVVTDDATPPNLDYLWERYKMKVACRMTKGQVCAKYSYSFNNIVTNITYMCTKVVAHEEGAVTSGCYTQVIDGNEVQLCVCESGRGDIKPCNAAVSKSISLGILILPVLFTLYKF